MFNLQPKVFPPLNKSLVLCSSFIYTRPLGTQNRDRHLYEVTRWNSTTLRELVEKFCQQELNFIICLKLSKETYFLGFLNLLRTPSMINKAKGGGGWHSKRFWIDIKETPKCLVKSSHKLIVMRLFMNIFKYMLRVLNKLRESKK